MDSGVALILGFTIYKVASVACGAFVCWLGYKLFLSGLWNPSGDVEAKFHSISLVIKSAAPGTFFAVLGMSLSLVAVYRGYDLNLGQGLLATEMKPHVNAKPILP